MVPTGLHLGGWNGLTFGIPIDLAPLHFIDHAGAGNGQRIEAQGKANNVTKPRSRPRFCGLLEPAGLSRISLRGIRMLSADPTTLNASLRVDVASTTVIWPHDLRHFRLLTQHSRAQRQHSSAAVHVGWCRCDRETGGH